MSYYKVCPICGSHLDPGESCADCQEKTARGATNTTDSKVEKALSRPESASIVHENGGIVK